MVYRALGSCVGVEGNQNTIVVNVLIVITALAGNFILYMYTWWVTWLHGRVIKQILMSCVLSSMTQKFALCVINTNWHIYNRPRPKTGTTF